MGPRCIPKKKGNERASFFFYPDNLKKKKRVFSKKKTTRAMPCATNQFVTNDPQGCGCTVGPVGGLSNQGTGEDRSRTGSDRRSKRRSSTPKSSSRSSRRNRRGDDSSSSGSYSSSRSGCCGRDGSQKRCNRGCNGIGPHSRGGNGRQHKGKRDKKLYGLRPYGWVQQNPYPCRVYFNNVSGF